MESNIAIELRVLASLVSANRLEEIPYERDEDFIGREQILQEIEMKSPRYNRLALYGLGGVGYNSI